MDTPIDSMTTVEQLPAALNDPNVSKTRRQKLKQRLKQLQVGYYVSAHDESLHCPNRLMQCDLSACTTSCAVRRKHQVVLRAKRSLLPLLQCSASWRNVGKLRKRRKRHWRKSALRKKQPYYRPSLKSRGAKKQRKLVPRQNDWKGRGCAKKGSFSAPNNGLKQSGLQPKGKCFWHALRCIPYHHRHHGVAYHSGEFISPKCAEPVGVALKCSVCCTGSRHHRRCQSDACTARRAASAGKETSERNRRAACT